MLPFKTVYVIKNKMKTKKYCWCNLMAKNIITTLLEAWIRVLRFEKTASLCSWISTKQFTE